MVDPLTVLVVEDNADGRAALCALLRRVGYTVEEAANGPEGVEKGVALRPGVALVDIGLPGLDGYEVARRLRAALGEAAVLLAYTAYSRPGGDAASAFDGWLTKPTDPKELLRLLARGRQAPVGQQEGETAAAGTSELGSGR